jgi:hypothetical protein
VRISNPAHTNSRPILDKKRRHFLNHYTRGVTLWKIKGFFVCFPEVLLDIRVWRPYSQHLDVFLTYTELIIPARTGTVQEEQSRLLPDAVLIELEVTVKGKRMKRKGIFDAKQHV